MQRSPVPDTLRRGLLCALAMAALPAVASAQDVAPTLYLSPAPYDGPLVLAQSEPAPVLMPLPEPPPPPPSRVRVRLGYELAVHAAGSPYRSALSLYTGSVPFVSSRMALSAVANVVGPFVLGGRVAFGGGDFGRLSFDAAGQSLFVMDFSAQAGVLWRGGSARHRGSIGVLLEGGVAYGSITLRNERASGGMPRVAGNVEGGYHGRVGERTWLGFSVGLGVEYLPWRNVGDRGLDLVLGGPVCNFSLELVR